MNRTELMRSRSQAKLKKIRASLGEMMMSSKSGETDGSGGGGGTSFYDQEAALSNQLFNENGIDMDERFLDVTTARQDVDYRVGGVAARNGGVSSSLDREGASLIAEKPSSITTTTTTSTIASGMSSKTPITPSVEPSSSSRNYRKSRSREDIRRQRPSVGSPKRIKVKFLVS